MKKASEFLNLFRPQKQPQEGLLGEHWQAPSAWNAFLPPDRFGMGRTAAPPVRDAGTVPSLLALLLQGNTGAGAWAAPVATNRPNNTLTALLRQSTSRPSAPRPPAPPPFKPLQATLPKPLATPVVKAKPLPAAGCGHSLGWPVAGKPLNKGR